MFWQNFIIFNKKKSLGTVDQLDELNDLEHFDFDDEDELDQFNTETFAGGSVCFLIPFKLLVIIIL